jgi:hypothetical protein
MNISLIEDHPTSEDKQVAWKSFVTRRHVLEIFLFAVVSLSSPALAEGREGKEGMIHQLRIYEIFEHNKAAFHARFRDHAARIMKKHDFDIVAMWESRSPDRTEFIYVLRWPDQATMTSCWADFMADREWSDIKEETAAAHGDLVGDIQDRVLQMTDYSPRL